MWCKISKNKTNPYTISTIAIFLAASISGSLGCYYCFFAYPAAVYAQQQSKGNVNNISEPNCSDNTTSQ